MVNAVKAKGYGKLLGLQLWARRRNEALWNPVPRNQSPILLVSDPAEVFEPTTLLITKTTW